MYLSSIKKQADFTTLLNKLEFVTEVYSSVDFSMEQDKADFYFVCKEPIDSTRAYLTLCEMFDIECHIYIVFDAYSALLKDKRIIWREGVWYL